MLFSEVFRTKNLLLDDNRRILLVNKISPFVTMIYQPFRKLSYSFLLYYVSSLPTPF